MLACHRRPRSAHHPVPRSNPRLWGRNSLQGETANGGHAALQHDKTALSLSLLSPSLSHKHTHQQPKSWEDGCMHHQRLGLTFSPSASRRWPGRPAFPHTWREQKSNSSHPSQATESAGSDALGPRDASTFSPWTSPPSPPCCTLPEIQFLKKRTTATSTRTTPSADRDLYPLMPGCPHSYICAAGFKGGRAERIASAPGNVVTGWGVCWGVHN